MTPLAWSLLLSGLAVVCTWMIGNRDRNGFLLAAFSQALWALFAVMSSQWGFLISAAVFGVLNIRNYMKWAPTVADRREKVTT